MPETASTESVDVVVVGSGFGGSVAAYRLAEAGRSVVVLERGRAYPPGSFARTPSETAKSFWEPGEGRHGLFQVWSFDGIDGLVSSGLGGGSLIYANVLLRKDEKWFVHEQPLPHGGYEHWPISRADLDPHYDAVESMIGVSPYPYQDTPKTMAMEEAAAGAGLSLQRPPLAVAFSRRPGEDPVRQGEIPLPAYGNIHGVPRTTCSLVGECDVGCNNGAKNSLDHTYLSAAKHAGADIRVRHEVKGFRPLEGGGYEVTYVVHTGADGEPATDLPVRTIRTRRLVLAAGTFGTNYLLLRNRSAFPGISGALGTRFTGNGDLLGFVMDASRDGLGRDLGANTGPVITTAIRLADEADGDGAAGRGHYIEDAGYPAFAAWLAESGKGLGTLARAFQFGYRRAVEDLTNTADSTVGADIAEMIGPGTLTATSLPLLGMGRDIPDGVMRLSGGRLEIDWTTETSLDYFDGVRGTMRAIAGQLGGTYYDNPIWWAKRVITVHPLGGSPMGRHEGEGVCDPYGEVYGYPGLYVMDGALLPGPVGANPSLTIAAVADRACTHLLSKVEEGALAPVSNPRSLVEEGALAPVSKPGDGGSDSTDGFETVAAQPPQPAVAAQPPQPAVAAQPPQPTGTASGLLFTEQMKGFVALGVDDPQTGHDQGRKSKDRLMFELTISVDDVDRFVAEPGHEGSATGYVESDLLGGRLDVERGWFNLFVEDDDVDQRQMRYRLWLRGPGGNPMTFVGVKEVRDEAGLDVWRDTSTLYVKILEGHHEPPAPGSDDDAPVLAAGVITIHIPDFMRQLTTFRTWGDSRVGAMEGFGRLFLGQLWDVYGRFFRDRDDESDERGAP
ncbi:FAD-binding protein [Nocardioides agariphilus]|uniref:Cholesterol oxidase n=1 Tax=Nocardioides agariphilus TaxID=433664 RepID=A0A930VRJ6_9ACTN|nr:FAD-dependent oxidoreductase [Nocardioides agariphilus]MBF4769581.1 FAD-binding protein [Nocardioides agariphilus]